MVAQSVECATFYQENSDFEDLDLKAQNVSDIALASLNNTERKINSSLAKKNSAPLCSLFFNSDIPGCHERTPPPPTPPKKKKKNQPPATTTTTNNNKNNITKTTKI